MRLKYFKTLIIAISILFCGCNNGWSMNVDYDSYERGGSINTQPQNKAKSSPSKSERRKRKGEDLEKGEHAKKQKKEEGNPPGSESVEAENNKNDTIILTYKGTVTIKENRELSFFGITCCHTENNLPKKLISILGFLQKNHTVTPPPCSAMGGAIVNLLQVNGSSKAVVKYFEKGRDGEDEYKKSKEAYQSNPDKGTFKMAEVLAGLKPVEEKTKHQTISPFLMISEPAQGRELYCILSDPETRLSESKLPDSVQAAINYLAAFHVQAYKAMMDKNTKEQMGPRIIKVQHRINQEKQTMILFSKGLESEKDMSPEFKEKFKNKLQRLIGPTVQAKDDHLKSANNQMIQNTKNGFFDGPISSEELLTITLTHGDATTKNLFYNADNPNKDEKLINKIMMIDYAQMDYYDPARDVGRFIGSLWEWLINTEKNEKNRNEFLQKLLLWEKKIKKSYFKILKENKFSNFNLLQTRIEFHKQYLFKAILTHPKNISTKNYLINLWLEEQKEPGSISQTTSRPETTYSTESCTVTATSQPHPTPSLLGQLIETVSWGTSSIKQGIIELAKFKKEEIKNPIFQGKEQPSGKEKFLQTQLEQKAKIAALNLFQPLITELTCNKQPNEKLVQSLTRAGETINKILDNPQNLDPNNINEINKLIEESANDSFQKTIKSTRVSLTPLGEPISKAAFYQSIIDLRNTIHFNILKKYFDGTETCPDCNEVSIKIEKILSEPVRQCWVCGYEEF